jgi:phospholipid/cholesterol/gamma-HCH transport system substrate-binding protein
VARLLKALPRGFRTISEERAQLVRTLRAVGDFGKIAHRVVNGTEHDFQQNLDNLAHITREFADHGKTLADSFDALTYPFNTRDADKVIYGDYMNLITEIEVSAEHLTEHWLGGTPLDGLFPAVIDGTPTGPATDAEDPLSVEPLDDLLDEIDGLLGGDRDGGRRDGPRDDESSSGGDGLLGNTLGLLGGN